MFLLLTFLIAPGSHLLILLPARLHIFFRQPHQSVSTLHVAAHEHTIARFVVSELLQRERWLSRVEDERVLPVFEQSRIVAVQGPVSCLHRQLLLVQPLTHIYTVSYTVAIG